MGYTDCFGKKRYTTEELAKKVANRRMWDEKQEGNVIKLRVYPCNTGPRPCGGFHITKCAEPPKNLEQRLQSITY